MFMVLSSWPIATASVHPVHIDECRSARRAAADPPTKPTDLSQYNVLFRRYSSDTRMMQHWPSPDLFTSSYKVMTRTGTNF